MKGYVTYSDLRKFIDLVCEHPQLYDPSANHTATQSSKEVWQSITADMDIPTMNEADWKNKWKCLRDTFVKKKKEIRLADTQEKIDKATNWKFFTSMAFLDPFVDRYQFKPRVPRSNGIDYQHFTIIKNEEYEEGDSAEEEEEEGDSSFSSHRKRSSQGTSSTEEVKRRRSSNQVYEGDMTEVDDENESAWNAEGSLSKSFFQSCSYRMDKLPEQVQSYLQLQISQLFFNAENPDVTPVAIMPLPPRNSSSTHQNSSSTPNNSSSTPQNSSSIPKSPSPTQSS